MDSFRKRMDKNFVDANKDCPSASFRISNGLRSRVVFAVGGVMAPEQYKLNISALWSASRLNAMSLRSFRHDTSNGRSADAHVSLRRKLTSVVYRPPDGDPTLILTECRLNVGSAKMYETESSYVDKRIKNHVLDVGKLTLYRISDQQRQCGQTDVAYSKRGADCRLAFLATDALV